MTIIIRHYDLTHNPLINSPVIMHGKVLSNDRKDLGGFCICIYVLLLPCLFGM